MTRVLLVRHGQTEWNRQKRYQGTSDVPLAEAGREQAHLVARRLQGEGVDAILSSPLRRAWETACTVGEHLRLPPEADERLREICFGFWEGLTHTEIARDYPEDWGRWTADPLHWPPGRGETLVQVAARVGQVLDDLIRRYPDRTVLLVGHGGSLRVFLCLALGVPPERSWQFPLKNCSLSEVCLYPEGGILTLHNDRHYLDTDDEGTR